MKIIHGPVQVAHSNSAGLSSKSEAAGKPHTSVIAELGTCAVRLDEGKMRYLNILAQDHHFLGAKFCTATWYFRNYSGNFLTVLKQLKNPAPALMHIEASLAQQYHKMGMKSSPATTLDCVFGIE